MIEVSGVSCGYNDKTILRNVSFSIQTGKAVCILGANGIGKTTLFRAILGLLPVLRGQIRIEEKSIKEYSHRGLSKMVAYVPQAKSIFYQHTVEDIILMGRSRFIKPLSSPSENDYRKVAAVMASLNISHMWGVPYSDLSGGEQQLILIGRAMAQETAYILMDEPASNLDLANQGLLLQTINRLKSKNVGVLMISHVPTHAYSCCEDTLVIFQDGTSRYGPTDQIVTSENLKKAYNTNVEIIDGISSSGKKVHTYCLV